MSVKSQGVATAASKVIYDMAQVDLEKNPPELLHVEWYDHTHMSRWGRFQEHISSGQVIPLVRSVGYRLYEDKEKIILSSSVVPEHGDCLDSLTILKATEVSRTPLTKKRIKK